MSRQATKRASGRGRLHAEDLREHLLRHTLKVLLRDGYQGFSMSSVAVSAQASKETLYRHFGDKLGLLGAAFEMIGKGVAPLMLEGVTPDMTRQERLARLAENYLDGLLQPESLTLQRIAYADGKKGLGPLFARMFSHAALAVVAEQFSEMRSPDPELDAEIFLAMVQGFVRENMLLGVDSDELATKRANLQKRAVLVFEAYLDRHEPAGESIGSSADGTRKRPRPRR
jgi:TetR/AcrR family transcriptional regulator, mexJK operon transcriptional repressor